MNRYRTGRAIAMYAMAFCVAASPPVARAATSVKRSQPMTLAEAVSRALAHDPAVRGLEGELRIAHARARLARRDLLPTFTLGYSMMDSVRYAGPDTTSRRVSLGVEQLVTAGGRRRAGHRIESIRASAVLREHQDQVRSVTNTTMELIARVLVEEMAYHLFERTHDVAQDQLRIARAEFALGLATHSDLTELDIAVRAIELEAIESGHALAARRAAVRRVLGIEPGPVPRFRVTIDPDYAGSVDLESLRSTTTFERTAPVLAAETRAAVAEEELRSARSAWFPSFQIGLELSASGEQFPLHEPGLSLTGSIRFGAPVLPNETRVTVGTGALDERTRALSSTIHPGDGLLQFPSLASARLTRDQSRDAVKQTRREVADAAAEAGERIELLRARIELLRRRLELHRDLAAIRELQLRLGEITRNRALEQDVEATRTEVELLRTIATLFSAELHLVQLVPPDSFPEWGLFIEEAP